MFKNIGGKLKTISKIFLIMLIIYILSSIFSDIWGFIDDLPYSIVVYLVQLLKYIVICFGIYGFGTIVEDISAIRKIYENDSFRRLNDFSDADKNK